MKKLCYLAILLIAGIYCPAMLQAENGTCPALKVDLKKGTINGVKATASQKKVKASLPCFTGSTSEDEPNMNCGGGVFFLNHDFYYYTGRDYIEVRKNFKGKSSIEVLGKSLEALKKTFGAVVRTEKSGSSEYHFFATKYGCLVVCMYNNAATQFSMHYKKADDVKLCL